MRLLLAGVPRSYVTVTDKLSSFDSLTHYSQLKEEKRQKAKEMKEKMRSTMKKGAAAIQQAAKKPPNLQDILKKRNAVGNNEDGGESISKPTLAGAAAAALAQTKNKARESMAQLQKSGKDERSADATDDNDNTAQNPRLALMNSLRRRTPTPTSESEHVASADPRAALMGAIRSKSKGATDSVSEEEITFVDDSLSGGRGEASEDDDNEDQSSPPLDPRAAMLSAIKKKKNTKGTSNALGKSDAKQINTSDDPRSALLSAIKSKKKGDGDGDGSVTNNTNSSELACIANRNLRSRGNSTSDSREDGDNAASPVHANQVHHDEELARGLVLTKSVANLLLDKIGDNEDSVEINADNAEDAVDDLLVRRSMRIVWRLLVLNACFVVAHMKYTSLHVVCLFCAFIDWWCYMYRITGTI